MNELLIMKFIYLLIGLAFCIFILIDHIRESIKNKSKSIYEKPVPYLIVTSHRINKNSPCLIKDKLLRYL